MRELRWRLSQIGLAISLAIAANLLQAQTLQVYTQSWPPYSYEKDGKLTGYSTELLQAVLQEANIDANYKIMSWSRAFQLASEGANSLIYTTTRTSEREDDFEWIGPVATRKLWLFKLAERKDIQINGKDD